MDEVHGRAKEERENDKGVRRKEKTRMKYIAWEKRHKTKGKTFGKHIK